MSNDAPFIRPVPQIMPGTALTVSTGKPICSLSFPAAGGIQGIDALGTVLPLANATGSLIPTPDNTDSLGEITTPLRWANGYFATSVMTPMLSTPGTLSTQANNVIQLSNDGTAVNYWKFTNSATGSALPINAVGTDANISMSVTPKGTGTISLVGPSLVTPVAAASGSVTALTVTSAANTGQAAGVNAPAVDLSLANTVTFATGAMASLTAVRLLPPTYAFVAASTITNAASLYIDSAPIAGANATITNNYAILVAAGNVRFGDNIITGGNLSFAGAAPSLTATAVDQGISLVSNGTGTISLNAGATGSVQLGANAAALIGEFGVAPTARSAAINDAAGGATVDAEARAAINALLAYLRLRGTVAP